MTVLWVQNIIHASKKEKRKEHYSCLTSHRNQHPQAPESFWEQASCLPGYSGLTWHLSTTQKGLRAKKVWEVVTFLFMSRYCNNSAGWPTDAQRRDDSTAERERELSWVQGGVELKGRQEHLKPLNFTNQNKDSPELTKHLYCGN